MTQERPTPPSRPGGKNESWRVERMVQRVPAHLGETTSESVSPWIMVAGIVLLVLVVCSVLFFLLGGTARFFAPATTPTPTRPRAITPAVTIIPVTAPPASPASTPTLIPDKYTIKSGDTLIEIAAKYKVSVQSIMAANGMKDEKIRIGDVLLIPRPTPTPPPPTKPPPGTTTPVSQDSPPTSSGVIVHTVQSGDTLIAIAATYGSTVDAIRIANQLDSDFLKVGQTLSVPNSAWTPPATVTVFAPATPNLGSPFAYAAPTLLWPPDNFIARGSKDAPTLAWASPATLKPNEFYVLNVSTGAGATKKSWSFQIKQGTSKTLEASMYSGADGARFAWYVVVVSQTAARAPATSATLSASSPPSETRVFVWQ